MGADKSVADLPDDVKELIRRGAFFEIELLLPDYGISERVTGKGHPRLSLTHPEDVVVRKSNFVCERTLLISANKAACDLSREMVEYLKDKNTEIVFTLRPLRAEEIRD